MLPLPAAACTPGLANDNDTPPCRLLLKGTACGASHQNSLLTLSAALLPPWWRARHASRAAGSSLSASEAVSASTAVHLRRGSGAQEQ